MKRIICTIMLLLMMAGCSHLPFNRRGKLDDAVALMEKGWTTAAVRALTSIAKDKPVAGITDEALFRLGLLTLRSGSDNESALAYLTRLQKEFPTSSWARTAAPLADLLNQYEEVRHQNRNLKNVNQTLSKENKDLLQNLERLKSLDLELERKTIGK